MDKEKLERLKHCELTMLQAFIEVCEKLNLKYYLVEGTLLGAVRHQGFIPWDDDIDVGMPRDDYERFLLEAQPLLPSYYFVQSIYSEHDYHGSFAKIRDCRTTFIESSVKDRLINHGVYIDIFPIDFVSQKPLICSFIRLADQICTIRIMQIFNLPPIPSGLVKRIRGYIGRLISYVCFPKSRQAVVAQNRLYAACTNSDMVTNYASAWKERERMPVEWYGEGVIMAFEGIPVRVPTEYDKWLKQVYGDYMTPPPPEKRIAHHYTEVIDLDHPYTEYTQKKLRD